MFLISLVVYCRSAPVEYGSITPPPASGVDFLTQQYPFGCKTVGQNFVCFTARPISVDLAPHLSTGPKRSPSPNRIVPPAIVTDVPPVVAVIPTAIPELPEKKPIKSRGNKKGAVIEREDSKRISLKPETDPVKLKLIKQTSVEFIVKSMEVREPRLAASNIAIADVEATNGLKKVSSRKSLKNKLITAVTGPLHQQLQLQLRGVEGLDPLDFSPDDISSGDTSSDDSDVASVESTKGNITARKTPRQHIPPYADQHQRKRLAVPIFLLELSSFRETHATVASKADCLTFTQALVLKNDHRSNWYTCVAPLYEWMALDESTLKRLNYIIPGNNAAVDASFLPHPPDSPVSIALITGSSSSNQFTFGPTAESSVIPLNGKRISPVHTSTNTPHTSQPSIVMKNNGPGLNDGNHGLGFALGGTQEAKDKRAEQLKNLIESRRGMLLAHDKLCDNEDANRKREEKSAKFHLLPSIVSSTELGVSQYDISLALKRRNVAKQHVKLLDTLVASAPLRTVQTASADSFHRVK